MDAEEAGANPARSRHCHRGAILTAATARTSGRKAEGSPDPGARRLRPSARLPGARTPSEDRRMLSGLAGVARRPTRGRDRAGPCRRHGARRAESLASRRRGRAARVSPRGRHLPAAPTSRRAASGIGDGTADGSSSRGSASGPATGSAGRCSLRSAGRLSEGGACAARPNVSLPGSRRAISTAPGR